MVEAHVILSKCDKTGQLFGIRVEKRENDWVRTWTFKIDEKAAKREGFDKTILQGSFYADPDFPGCPYCGNKSFYTCGECGKMNCLPGSSEEITVTCKWCGNEGELCTEESFDISGRGY
ncbi:MAG: hypothetical protein LBG12_04925 [Synergistaceae bacterium]|jgi:hypothetical protein|nr:hypothetical protein [Synergistaceae bacterium]